MPLGRLAPPLLFSLLALCALPANAGAGELHVRIESIPCEERDRLAREIEARSRAAMEGRRDLYLVIVREPGEELSLIMAGAPKVYEKRLPFTPDDCAELPTMASLVLQSWLSESWRPPPTSTRAREPVEHLSTKEGSPDVRQGRPALWLALLGGLGSNGALFEGWAPGLSIELSAPVHGPLALGLRGRFDGPVRTEGRRGALRATLLSLELPLTFGLPLPLEEGAVLELSAAPALQSGAVDSSAAGDISGSESRLGLTLATRLSAPIGRQLSLLLSLEGALYQRALFFTSDESGRMELSNVRLALMAGLTWGFP